jgi:FAD dependent oxidoreductase
MKEKFPEFKEIELAGTAPELYVRESRHMKGLYRLSIRYYPGLKAAASMFLVKKITKDTINELAKPVTETSISNDFKRMRAMFPVVFTKEEMTFNHDTQSVNTPISLSDLTFNLLRSTDRDVPLDNALDTFKKEGFLLPETEKMIQHPDRLTTGECYMIYKDFVSKSANVQFE